MSKMSELDIELQNLAFDDEEMFGGESLSLEVLCCLLPNVEINPTMNTLLDDGNNEEVEEYLAVLELDRIVWIPINANQEDC